jgi:DNA invertase Pin-like site-specific DNA recombinase
MKILYTRTSTLDQKTDRQRITEKNFDLVFEDKVLGSIPFFERPEGKKIYTLLLENKITSLSVWQVDRLGRNLLDILSTIKLFSDSKININFIDQSLNTLLESGSENPIATMFISMLGCIGQMTRKQILENQKQGIEIAKIKGTYRGRKTGSVEAVSDWATKNKVNKVKALLNKGVSYRMIQETLDCSPNFIGKVKKNLLEASTY